MPPAFAALGSETAAAQRCWRQSFDRHRGLLTTHEANRTRAFPARELQIAYRCGLSAADMDLSARHRVRVAWPGLPQAPVRLQRLRATSDCWLKDPNLTRFVPRATGDSRRSTTPTDRRQAASATTPRVHGFPMSCFHPARPSGQLGREKGRITRHWARGPRHRVDDSVHHRAPLVRRLASPAARDTGEVTAHVRAARSRRPSQLIQLLRGSRRAGRSR